MVAFSKNSQFSPNNSFRAKTIQSAMQVEDDDELVKKAQAQGSYNPVVDTQGTTMSSLAGSPLTEAEQKGVALQDSTGPRETNLGPSQPQTFNNNPAPTAEELDNVGTDLPGQYDNWQPGATAPVNNNLVGPQDTTLVGPGADAATLDAGGNLTQDDIDPMFLDSLLEILQQEDIDAEKRIADERAIMEAGLGGNLADLAAQMGGAGFGQSGQALQGSYDLENQAAMNFNQRAADIEDMARREKLERLDAELNAYGKYTDIQGAQQRQALIDQILGIDGAGGPGPYNDPNNPNAPSSPEDQGYGGDITSYGGAVAAGNKWLADTFGTEQAQAVSGAQNLDQAYEALGIDSSQVSKPGEKYGPGTFPTDSTYVVAKEGQTLYYSPSKGEYYLVEGTPQQTLGMVLGGLLPFAGLGAGPGGDLAGSLTGTSEGMSNPFQWILNAANKGNE